MMNQWDRPNPWISLPFEILSPDDGFGHEQPPFELASEYFTEGNYSRGTVWYIGSEIAPDFLSRDELRWLEQNYLECGQREFEGEVFVEVVQFNQIACK
jgi:hypothetical protein